MDPQQRLLLEVAWEALEHAGIAADAPGRHAAPASSSASCDSDYVRPAAARDRAAIDAYTGTGNALQRRRRPARLLARRCRARRMAVDTACSSSLVAVHLACRRCAPASATWRWPAAST